MADSSDRGLANWIHDRLWAHIRRELDPVHNVLVIDQGVTREIAVGIRYRARAKRHSAGDRIRSYPTRAALAFWAQSNTLEGLEEVTLGFGYRWDVDERAIGGTVVSLRDGLDEEAIWVVEVDAAAGPAGRQIRWTPMDPSLPQLDLHETVAADEDEAT